MMGNYTKLNEYHSKEHRFCVLHVHVPQENLGIHIFRPKKRRRLVTLLCYPILIASPIPTRSLCIILYLANETIKSFRTYFNSFLVLSHLCISNLDSPRYAIFEHATTFQPLGLNHIILLSMFTQ